MRRTSRIAVGIAAFAFALTAGTVFAQPYGMGPGMMHGMHHGMGGGHGPMAGPVGMLTQQDAGSSADMGLVHDLLMSHASIRRSVTNLSDGIKTVTESDDPRVARAIKAHVAGMSQRLDEGREFNIFSTTLPVLFQNREKIHSSVEMTDKGAVVTRTSADPKVVAALQGHATEVTELVHDGMFAMRRGMMRRMAMGPQPFRGDQGRDVSPENKPARAPQPAR
ncbi:MAG: hypothetical protein ACXW20_13110 [Burkholderiales bacterium]